MDIKLPEERADLDKTVVCLKRSAGNLSKWKGGEGADYRRGSLHYIKG